MRLELVPQDHIKSGYVNYSIDGDQLTLQGEAVIKIGWFSRTFPINKVFTAPEGSLKKSAYLTPGTVHEWQGATITVVQVDENKLSHCSVSYPASNLSGLSTLDCSGDPGDSIVVLAVHGQVTVHGITQVIEANKA